MAADSSVSDLHLVGNDWLGGGPRTGTTDNHVIDSHWKSD